MTTFDLFIPYNLYDGDPIQIDSYMNGFADYILEKYKETIDFRLNEHDRYSRYKEVYGRVLREFIESKGYPVDVEFSGSLIVDSMVKKETREGILFTISPMSRLKGRPIEQLVRIMEYGTSKFPALNILRKSNRDVMSNLRRYYEEYGRTNKRSRIR